jgi:ferric-dicitrate binding protein FerR (iron transport regulator)
MKKLLYLSLAFVLLLAAVLLAAWWNMPRLCSYAISRMAGGKAEVRETALSYKDGLFHIELRGLTMDVPVKARQKAGRWW